MRAKRFPLCTFSCVQTPHMSYSNHRHQAQSRHQLVGLFLISSIRDNIKQVFFNQVCMLACTVCVNLGSVFYDVWLVIGNPGWRETLNCWLVKHKFILGGEGLLIVSHLEILFAMFQMFVWFLLGSVFSWDFLLWPNPCSGLVQLGWGQEGRLWTESSLNDPSQSISKEVYLVGMLAVTQTDRIFKDPHQVGKFGGGKLGDVWLVRVIRSGLIIISVARTMDMDLLVCHKMWEIWKGQWLQGMWRQWRASKVSAVLGEKNAGSAKCPKRSKDVKVNQIEAEKGLS